MTDLDICDMKFDNSEIGDMIKSSTCLYTWDFNLEGKKHKIELTHSRIIGKRIIKCDGEEINTSIKYTYSYTYSFPMDGHYFTVIQTSPGEYDLRIDNISFDILKNQNKRRQRKNNDYEEKQNKEKHTENNNDDNFFKDAGDFDFGDNENKKDKSENSLGNATENFDFGKPKTKYGYKLSK